MKDGKPVPSLSLTGALAVGVPGEVAGLVEARRRFGTLPLAALVAPALKLASNGFPLDPTLRIAIERQQTAMKRFADLGSIYLAQWRRCPPKARLSGNRRWPRLSKRSRQQGSQVFYQGWIGAAIVDTIKKNGGVMTLG